jgi:hypothetical protein
MANDTLFATTVALFCALALMLRHEWLPACAILVPTIRGWTIRSTIAKAIRAYLTASAPAGTPDVNDSDMEKTYREASGMLVHREPAWHQRHFDGLRAVYQSALRAAPPAVEAREDTQLLDFLDSEVGRVDPMVSLVIKAYYFRDSHTWANCAGSARQELRAALEHARASRSPETGDKDK